MWDRPPGFPPLCFPLVGDGVCLGVGVCLHQTPRHGRRRRVRRQHLRLCAHLPPLLPPPVRTTRHGTGAWETKDARTRDAERKEEEERRKDGTTVGGRSTKHGRDVD